MAKRFVPLWLFASAVWAQEPAADSYPELIAAFERAAASDGPEAAAAQYAPRFLAAAQRVHGTAAAVPLLQWVALHGGLAKETGTAIEALLADHLTDPALASVADRLPHLITYGTVTAEPLQRLLAASLHPEVEARARFASASLTFARLDASREELMTARENLGKAFDLTKDKALAARATSMATDDRSLAVGSVGPEIAGFDLDGAPFRLSDYRGKVVVLDFWGDW